MFRWPIMLAAAAALSSPIAPAQPRAMPLDTLRSGLEFAGPDVRAMQADDVANPAFLWVERGEKSWRDAGGGKSCASCHGDAAASMRGVAVRYPAFDRTAGEIIDLEARMNACRVRHQGAKPLERESDELLALTAYVAYQSRGMPITANIDGPARATFERGRAFYTAYRLEWQTLGSLQRRIRACLFGVRAEMPSPGASELTDVELYLAWRAQGLPLETPGVRR